MTASRPRLRFQGRDYQSEEWPSVDHQEEVVQRRRQYRQRCRRKYVYYQSATLKGITSKIQSRLYVGGRFNAFKLCSNFTVFLVYKLLSSNDLLCTGRTCKDGS